MSPKKFLFFILVMSPLDLTNSETPDSVLVTDSECHFIFAVAVCAVCLCFDLYFEGCSRQTKHFQGFTGDCRCT